jgi:hypothetical protein
MASDSSFLRQGIASISDFQKLQQEFELNKKLKQAQINETQQKLTQVDVDKLGEQAFMKAAMGQPLSMEEQAAAMFIDAKSGGLIINSATGDVIKKPRISDKIGLPGIKNAPQQADFPKMAGGRGDMVMAGDIGPFPQMTADDVAAANASRIPNNQLPPPPTGGTNRLNTKERMNLSSKNMESDRARLDAVIAASGSAGQAKSSARRMQTLQKDLGYTGTGSTPLNFIDKLATGMGAPDLIAGSPAARESFGRESVDQWVKAVEPLKGALTEREGARFDAAVPNLSMTPDGIKMMNELTVKLGQRAQEKSQFYQDYFQQNGSLYGADQVWEQYSDQNPIIPEVPMGNASNVQSIIDQYAD